MGAGDIASVAAEALTNASFPNADTVLTGPELLTYEQVAAEISFVTGYPVRYGRLTQEELMSRLAKAGLPADYGSFLVSLDEQISVGSEARLTDEVHRITGQKPRTFSEFAQESKSAWIR